MTRDELYERFLTRQDPGYRSFQIRLIPNIDPQRIIGVRTPALREIAREIGMDDGFLGELPHLFFEENQIHIFVLNIGTDFERVLSEVERFLPYVDNWATCDQLTPKIFKKHRRELLPHIRRWLKSDHPYTVRFAMDMLMVHFLDEDFDPEYPELVASVVSEEYYVRMMQAWYFATALAKQYDGVVSFIAGHRLEKWTHNKAIQKAVESYRIPDDRKEYLKTFRKR
ncbi:MAG: DNA alkylation repair protein [Oscillospiraceae bacterium]|nr:DNA alkylation repair protein [Oscillospiraceae bacterium]